MKIHTVPFTFSLLCAMAFLPFFSSQPVLAANKKVSIKLSKSTDTMEAGTTFSFKAKVKNAKASSVVWKSSDTSILSIKKKTGKAAAKKAGKATITARTGKKLVRLTVTVSPSASDLKQANNTWKNLHDKVFTSVSVTAASNTAGAESNLIYSEYSCLNENEEILSFQTVENSYFSYIDHAKKYTLSYASQNTLEEAFDENSEENNNFMLYSNAELLSAILHSDNSYTLVYMADIANMTQEEKKSVGQTNGTCIITANIEPEHWLVTSYKITNYDAAGTTATTVSGSISYNTENTLTLPEDIRQTAGISEPETTLS